MARDAILGIDLLGGFRITSGGSALRESLSSRLQSLVAYLALHPETPIPRQQLAFLFWPDSEESQARTNLRQLLHHLRTALPQSDVQLESDQHAIWWRPGESCAVDAIEFEQAVNRGDLEAAARLYRGDLLPAFYDEWIDSERERLRQIYEKALDRLASAAEQRGDFSTAIRFAEARLARDTMREASYQLLMRLHARSGDRAGALRVFEQCVAVLRSELGVTPSPATRGVRDEIMQDSSGAGLRTAVGVQRAGRAEAPPQAAGLPHATAHDIPLIGREREWVRLEAAWNDACRGAAHLVLLTGEPGIGKTRLLEELQGRARRDGASSAVASCYAGYRALSYTAAAEWLRSPAFRSDIDELPAVHRSQLAVVLPEIVLSEETEAMRPASFTESWRKRRLFEAIARALARPKAAVLLAIDDAQWCDPETLELLPYLIRFNASARLLIAATVRSDESAALRRTLDRIAVEIELGPLDQASTTRLAASVGGRSIEGEPAGSLFQRTKGNPLFVVETVRSGWSAADGVPAKVHSVITGRLEQLTSDGKEIAAVAAVVGRPFTAGLAVAITSLPEETVARAIDELWNRRFLDAAPGEAYDFSHGLLRDVAYDSIGPARRRLLHRLAAESFESLNPADADSASGWLARHYEQAGLPDCAIRWYDRAAQVSRRRFADQEAIAHLRKALDLIERLPATPERDRVELNLLLAFGLSLSATQGYASAEAGQVYARARIIGEIARDSETYFGVLAGSWTYHVVRGDLAVSREMGERYLALAERNGDPMLRAGGEFAVGCSATHLGLLRQGRELVEASIRHEAESERSGQFLNFGAEVGVFCGSYASHLAWLMGDAEAASERSREILARAEAISHPFSLSLAIAYSAMLHHFRDEPDLALEKAEAAAAVCRKHGFRYYLAWTPIIAGWAQTRLGDAEAGLAAMRQGYAELRSTGAGLRAPYYLILIAEGCGRCGNPQDGLRDLEEAARIMEASDERWAGPEWYRVRGDLLRQIGQESEAGVCYRNAVRLAHKIGARAWELRAGTASERF
jgi:DNA-binding SARP family transcriptional activator